MLKPAGAGLAAVHYASRHATEPGRLLKEDYVLLAPPGRKPGVVDATLKRLGRERCVAITVPDFASAARLAAASKMIVTMPSLIATHFAGTYTLYHFPPPLKLPSLDIAMASGPRSMTDAGVVWLAEQIRKHADHLCSSAAARRLDRGNVNLLHMHHRIECALCFGASDR